MKKKMLIVYYSYTNGNTTKIAEELEKATGADMEEIQLVEPYTGSYDDVVSQGQREVESGYEPAIKLLKANLEDYDVIAVGSPTWWYTVAPAVRTFLDQNNWYGKVVIPFQTHAGWPGHFMNDVEELCKGASIRQAIRIQFDQTGGSTLVTPQRDIDAWVKLVNEEE